MFRIAHQILDTILDRIVNSSYISRWTVLGIDLSISVASILACFYFSRQFSSNAIVLIPNFFLVGIYMSLVSLLFFLLFQTYAGIIRYSSYHEVGRLLVAVLCINTSCYVLGALGGYGQNAIFVALLLQNVTLSFVMLVAFRFIVFYAYRLFYAYNAGRFKKRSVIYGIESQSVALAGSLQAKGFQGYEIIGFLTKDKAVTNQRILNLPVYSYDCDLSKVLKENKISALILSDKKSWQEDVQSVIKECTALDVSVLTPQPMRAWNGQSLTQLSANAQLKELLGREEIEINLEKIQEEIQGRVVLVTGAAGSIGSEIVKQLAKFRPAKVILFDAAETPLNSLQLEMDKISPGICEAVLGDVRIKKRLEYVFQMYRPQIIYHAAAYKHVPMVEKNPCEAILTNVLGTRNIANYAVKFGVKKFVMVSTDKAVNPSNVMGASKRIAEIYVQSLANNSIGKPAPEFITTRFGNVLGSNGSVIPLFKEQIENGGPVTVTHPNIIRYFMTIPEACCLVLEASVMGKSGEIYVFDMGKPVRIADLAKKMIQMAGLEPNKDIRIVYTGLRPGEKLYEELLNDKEITQPTPHPKIKVARVRRYELAEVAKLQNDLIQRAMMVDIQGTVKKMKEIVPEFISMNSIYEQLDMPVSV